MEEYYFYTEGLTVGYHGLPLIKNIKISLKKGEILTLIGPNGAGKTTILRSIIKQLKPLGGVVVLDGKETELTVHTQSGLDLTKKYLRYKTNVEQEYFLRIPHAKSAGNQKLMSKQLL